MVFFDDLMIVSISCTLKFLVEIGAMIVASSVVTWRGILQTMGDRKNMTIKTKESELMNAR